MRKIKLALVVAGALYCAYHYQSTYQGAWHFIDNVNVVIHEAGHLVFYPLGNFITALGGSLLQVIIPALFFLYFFRGGKKYSAAVMLQWIAVNLFYISYYAADAIKMQLSLLGGEAVVHDWNYILMEAGLISQTSLVAGLISSLGFAAVAGSLYLAWKGYSALTLREDILPVGQSGPEADIIKEIISKNPRK